ncbi:MAG: hypothetical protein ACLGH4_02945 [Actinomycetes bacterium]
MLSLRTTHALLVASSALLALALASLDPVNVAVAVALHVVVGQLVGQAMVDEYDGDAETVRVRSRDRS